MVLNISPIPRLTVLKKVVLIKKRVFWFALIEDPRLRERFYKTKIFIFIPFLSHNSVFVFPSLSKNPEAKIKQRAFTMSICVFGNQCARKKP